MRLFSHFLLKITPTVLVCISGACLPNIAFARGASEQEKTAEGPVQMTLKLNKKSYAVGEPIVVSVTLLNTSGEQVEAGHWFTLPDIFSLELKDLKGKYIEMLRSSDGTVSWGLSRLPRQVPASTDIELTRGDIFKDEGGRVPRARLSPGAYILTADQGYSVGHYPNGKFYSVRQAVSFIVRPATHQEQDALRFFQYWEAPNPRYFKTRTRVHTPAEAALEQGIATEQWEFMKAQFLNLEKDYPHTVYAPYALYYSGHLSQVEENWPQAIGFYERVLHKYKNFPLRSDLLYYLALSYTQLGQKDKARQIVRSLKKRHPYPLISPTVEYFAPKTRLEVLEETLQK